jgi:2',3'-cyclic-nucleotide 2'-phosphodiesterase/3'-nucleotidase
MTAVRHLQRWLGRGRGAAFLLLSLSIAASACSLAPRAPVRLTVLATSDFHGALESSYEETESGRVLGGGPQLAATIARERARNPEGTVLVDAGDILHGTALSNLTEGRTSIDFFNLLAPDASVIGNHEFDWGVEALRQRIAEARFPLLLANVETRATGERPPWARAYEIVERRGVRIAIVGVVTETLAEEILAEHVAAHRFTDPVATARETIAGLVPSRADLAVVVCHCGLSEGDIFGTEVKEMAAGLPGVAAIVAGHTHERHALRLSGVPVVQPGFGGRYLARVDLSYDPRARTVTSGEIEILPVWADSQALAPEAVRRIEGYHDEVGTILAEELGTAAVDLDQDPNGECRLGNLLTDVIRDRFGVDMAFQNALGVRAPIASGTVRFSDVYGALPIDNTVVLMELTGAQIERMLSQADAASRLLYVSGLRYGIDRSRPAGERVRVVTKLQQDRTYKVAVNNYMAQGGEHLSVLEALEGSDTGVLLRDVLADHFRERAGAGVAVSAELDGRIELRVVGGGG